MAGGLRGDAHHRLPSSVPCSGRPSPSGQSGARCRAGSAVLSASREAGDVFTYILALFGVWSIVIPAVVVARQRDLDVTLKELALLPAYYLLVTVSAWIAIFDLIVRPHYWAKTAHGRWPQRLPRNLFLKPGAS